MTIVYLKLILAAVITAIPLFYEYYVRPKEKTSKVWRNMFTAIGSSMPFLSRFCNKMKQHAKRSADGMRKSDNFRKFFTYIVLLILIVIQFVDLQASQVVVQGAANMGLQKNSVHAMNYYLLFGGFYTSPFTYLITGVMSLVFFLLQGSELHTHHPA